MSQLMPLLVRGTGLSVHDIARIVLNAPARYKVFSIPKRSKGVREIAQPARELKALQRILMNEFLNDLPIHNSATAYRKGISIRDNATPHAGGGALMKMDFKDFFPSIGAHHWNRYCDAHNLIPDEEDRWIASRIFFYRKKGKTALRLAIGAPSSPMMSNILMYEFDNFVQRALERDSVVYTRYADDITFSAPRTGHLNAVRPVVERAMARVPWPKLEINEEKTVVATRKFKRSVTGLVLANDGRVTIGREKKRIISATVYRFSQGRLDNDQSEELSGMLAYIHAVEPEFLESLRGRYGAELISDIQGIGAKLAQSETFPPFPKRPHPL